MLQRSGIAMIQAYIPYKVVDSYGGFDEELKMTPQAMLHAMVYAVTSGQIDEEDVSKMCVLCGREAHMTGICAHAKDALVTVLGTKTVDNAILVVAYSVCKDCAPRYKEIEIKLRTVANN